MFQGGLTESHGLSKRRAPVVPETGHARGRRSAGTVTNQAVAYRTVAESVAGAATTYGDRREEGDERSQQRGAGGGEGRWAHAPVLRPGGLGSPAESGCRARVPPPRGDRKWVLAPGPVVAGRLFGGSFILSSGSTRKRGQVAASPAGDGVRDSRGRVAGRPVGRVLRGPAPFLGSGEWLRTLAGTSLNERGAQTRFSSAGGRPASPPDSCPWRTARGASGVPSADLVS